MQNLSLFVRQGDRIVPASPADNEIARTYPEFIDKGPAKDGYRLTVLTRSGPFRTDEEVHVIHIVEALEPGTELYVMGPKRVYGEFVDGILATEPLPDPANPLTPSGPYDGRVIPGPGIDPNYEITVYRFDGPGTHTICWRLGALESNTIKVQVCS